MGKTKIISTKKKNASANSVNMNDKCTGQPEIVAKLDSSEIKKSSDKKQKKLRENNSDGSKEWWRNSDKVGQEC